MGIEGLYQKNELLIAQLSIIEEEYCYWQGELAELGYDYQSDNGSWVAHDESYEEEILYQMDKYKGLMREIEDELDDVDAQIDIINSMKGDH